MTKPEPVRQEVTSMKPIFYALAAVLATVAVMRFLGSCAPVDTTEQVEALERARERLRVVQDSLLALGRRQEAETQRLQGVALEAERLAEGHRQEVARLRHRLDQVTRWRDSHASDADLIHSADSLVRALLGPDAYVQSVPDACAGLRPPPGTP